MKKRLLLKAFSKRQKNTLFGVFVFMLIVCVCSFTALSLLSSGQSTVKNEMNRLGFGDFTSWVTGDGEAVAKEIRSLKDTESVTVQPLIFSGYKIGEKYSDNEGELLVKDNSFDYHFIDENGKRIDTKTIEQGTVYISPALSSSFDVKVGDTVIFEVARNGGNLELTVAGYFEDPFMGSSMIDMKSFLINKADRAAALNLIENSSENDKLARNGAMLHIKQSDNSNLSYTQFRTLINEQTSLTLNEEFSYRNSAILSYMVLLQNVLSGFLLGISLILLVICLVFISHNLESAVETERNSIASLKTIGFTGNDIAKVFLTIYAATVFTAIATGFLLSLLLSRVLASLMLSSTGMLIQSEVPFVSILLALVLIAVPIITIILKLKTLSNIKPVRLFEKKKASYKKVNTIKQKGLFVRLSIRSLLTGWKKYVSLLVISLLLTSFLSVIGYMSAWLGSNGEGMMNAFSVAEHDLGVQPYNSDVPMDEIERVINWYSPIKEKYEIAMQSVSVNGLSVTANVLDKPEYFHILSGQVCDGNSVLLTDVVANELGVKVGDTVNITANARTESYTVSGIYMCANGMGSNIGMTIAGYSKIGDVTGYIWCYHYILQNGEVRDYAMKYLQDNYSGIDVHNNSWSGLDGIVSVMHTVMILIYVLAAVFIVISVWLISSKMLNNETYDLAVYKSFGFESRKLRTAFAIRFLIVATVGAFFGTALSSAVSGKLIGTVFNMLGIGDFSLTHGLLSVVIPPLTVILLFFSAALLLSGKIKKIGMVTLIAENDE